MVSRTYRKRSHLKPSKPKALKSSPRSLKNSRDHYRANKDTHILKMQEWRAANPGKVAKLAKNWREANPKYNTTYMKQKREGLIGPFTSEDGPDWQQRNRDHHLAQKRASTNRRRKEVVLEALRYYSDGEPKCYCCGEDILLLLSLDHIDGGGTKHRKESKITHTSNWAKRNGWPKIFRVACHSCNLGAHLNGGVCPHQKPLQKKCG